MKTFSSLCRWFAFIRVHSWFLLHLAPSASVYSVWSVVYSLQIALRTWSLEAFTLFYDFLRFSTLFAKGGRGTVHTPSCCSPPFHFGPPISHWERFGLVPFCATGNGSAEFAIFNPVCFSKRSTRNFARKHTRIFWWAGLRCSSTQNQKLKIQNSRRRAPFRVSVYSVVSFDVRPGWSSIRGGFTTSLKVPLRDCSASLFLPESDASHLK